MISHCGGPVHDALLLVRIGLRKKKEVELTEQTDIRKADFLTPGESCKTTFWPTPGYRESLTGLDSQRRVCPLLRPLYPTAGRYKMSCSLENALRKKKIKGHLFVQCVEYRCNSLYPLPACSVKPNDYLENLHVLSCFVLLKSLLLISCVFGIFFQNAGSQLCFRFFPPSQTQAESLVTAT